MKAIEAKDLKAMDTNGIDNTFTRLTSSNLTWIICRKKRSLYRLGGGWQIASEDESETKDFEPRVERRYWRCVEQCKED